MAGTPPVDGIGLSRFSGIGDAGGVGATGSPASIPRTSMAQRSVIAASLRYPAMSGIQSLHARLGSEAFWRIARCFYARIERHPTLRPMFPADLAEPIRNQAEFLIQYFGGPQDYSARKGHPRLRMRHAPFRIDLAAR
ncbi:MAG: hypothetical protein FJ253_10785, partial [Phycisphaerae bacterium]|nr:hypothetical protein [Phycisphaerae bacterium]